MKQLGATGAWRAVIWRNPDGSRLHSDASAQRRRGTRGRAGQPRLQLALRWSRPHSGDSVLDSIRTGWVYHFLHLDRSRGSVVRPLTSFEDRALNGARREAVPSLCWCAPHTLRFLDPAVCQPSLLEVLLMIFFGPPEIGCRHDFGNDRSPKLSGARERPF
jgi:hypothetical protein